MRTKKYQDLSVSVLELGSRYDDDDPQWDNRFFFLSREGPTVNMAERNLVPSTASGTRP